MTKQNHSQAETRLVMQDFFVGWQCRMREYALRSDQGRPNPAMCPSILLENGSQVTPAATLLLVPSKPQESINQFRFMSLKTHELKERYTKVLELLSSTFFQNIKDFKGEMSGLFSANSKIAESLNQHASCLLVFNYQQQQFNIPCVVRALTKDELIYQFTYWHNYLFNPYLTPEVQVLCFVPNWKDAVANPAPNSLN